ncbi:MAG: hypothetical protein ACXQTS_06455 [Candidatus Methanospirareceae archaeon]
MDTVKAFRDACNYISEVAWDNRVYNPVGVDIGINKLTSNGFSVNGKPIENRRRHFRKLRSSLLKKGTSSARRKLKRLSGREHRWVNTVLHDEPRHPF